MNDINYTRYMTPINICTKISSKRSPTKIILHFYSVHKKCSTFTIKGVPKTSHLLSEVDLK